MDGATRHFGGLDVAIANAGCIATESLATGSPERFEQVIDVNLSGVWPTFRAALPHVRERRDYLMAISSMAAFVHSPLQASYCASKTGVWAMCDRVRLEVRHLWAGVGSPHPTFFRTPLMQQVFDDPAGNRIWRGNKEGIWQMIPIDPRFPRNPPSRPGPAVRVRARRSIPETVVAHRPPYPLPMPFVPPPRRAGRGTGSLPTGDPGDGIAHQRDDARHGRAVDRAVAGAERETVGCAPDARS